MEKENGVKTVVPALRFPEFRGMEGWDLKPLNNILDYERPDNYIVETDVYCNEGIPVLTANKSFILGYTKESNGIYTNLPVVIFDDFTTDKKYVDFPFKVKSSAIKILHAKHTDILRFVYELINQITFEAKEHKRYYISTYQNIQVPIPQKNEQQKIADFLSSLDDLIEATNRKIEALKEHKKGLMQRLFPKDGENVPELRFPEFQGTKGWDKCLLGDFLLEPPRYGINAPAVPFQKELATYIRITDISENGTFVPSPKVSVDKDNIDNFYLNVGDLVFARTGASVGKCYEYREKDGKLVFAGFLIKITPNPTRLSSDFLFQYTFSKQYLKWVNLTSTRSGQPGINSKELFSMSLCLPKKQEQQKIADCLSSLDELIEATSRKVEILKEHKKGLMQQLFPKI